jgi:hypothetical protein
MPVECPVSTFQGRRSTDGTTGVGVSRKMSDARFREPIHPPLQKASAIPALLWSSKPRLRYSPGLAPTTRLNALLNAASDS